MDKELLIWKNKAAEAERNRQSANNKAMKALDMLTKSQKALREARAIFDKLRKADIYDDKGYLISRDGRTKFHKNEFVQAKNIVSHAFATGGMEVGEVVTVQKRELNDKPPVEPKSNDWYIDEEGKLHLFYLGRWHDGN